MKIVPVGGARSTGFDQRMTSSRCAPVSDSAVCCGFPANVVHPAVGAAPEGRAANPRTRRIAAGQTIVRRSAPRNDIARGSLLDGWNGSSPKIIQKSFETEGPVRLARRVIRDIVNRDAFAVERR